MVFTATATATQTGTSTSTSTATGNTLEEAVNNANKIALNSATYGLAPPTLVGSDKHTCEKFCLSCIDFRFVDDTSYYMSCIGDSNNYDQFILAGASLGYNGITGYDSWPICCNDNLQLSHNLHSISEVNIFDHLECGAYKMVYTEEELKGDGEFKLHVENLNKAERTILNKFPFVKKVNKYIFGMDFKPMVIP
jgi:hypothetical protein